MLCHTFIIIYSVSNDSERHMVLPAPKEIILCVINLVQFLHRDLWPLDLCNHRLNVHVTSTAPSSPPNTAPAIVSVHPATLFHTGVHSICYLPGPQSWNLRACLHSNLQHNKPGCTSTAHHTVMSCRDTTTAHLESWCPQKMLLHGTLVSCRFTLCLARQ